MEGGLYKLRQQLCPLRCYNRIITDPSLHLPLKVAGEAKPCFPGSSQHVSKPSIPAPHVHRVGSSQLHLGGGLLQLFRAGPPSPAPLQVAVLREAFGLALPD